MDPLNRGKFLPTLTVREVCHSCVLTMYLFCCCSIVVLICFVFLFHFKSWWTELESAAESFLLSKLWIWSDRPRVHLVLKGALACLITKAKTVSGNEKAAMWVYDSFYSSEEVSDLGMWWACRTPALWGLGWRGRRRVWRYSKLKASLGHMLRSHLRKLRKYKGV